MDLNGTGNFFKGLLQKYQMAENIQHMYLRKRTGPSRTSLQTVSNCLFYSW